MLPVDDWHDWLRVANIVVCFFSLFLLSNRFAKSGSGWNVKTKDYWYALVMWCVAGFAMGLEGIYRDSPPGARPVFIFIASAVTLKGILRKGSWGSNAD